MNPRWLTIAEQELRVGIVEIPGPEDHPRIVEYHSTTTLEASDDQVPWCSSFVNFCLLQSNEVGTDSARARSWLEWGVQVHVPPLGCVAVLKRGRGVQPGPDVIRAPGHVGFYYGRASNDEILLLGGNQSNEVRVSAYPLSSLLGYRWPR